jgi:hypothetical protein
VIRRISIRSQSRQKVFKTLSRKNPSQKRAGGVAQSVGPEFKPQYHNNNNNNKKAVKHNRKLKGMTKTSFGVDGGLPCCLPFI